MTIQRKLKNGITMRSKYEQHWIKPAGNPSLGTMTRQRQKRTATALAAVTVNQANPGMPRRERRQLARAYGKQITTRSEVLVW